MSDVKDNMNVKFSPAPGGGQPLLTVCAWCYPKDSIFEVAPQLRGLRISHGVCPAHERVVMSETPGQKSAYFAAEVAA